MYDGHRRHEHNSGIMDVGRGSCFTLVGRICEVECVVVENMGSGSMEAVGG
ncbi:hypothetical protein ERO13_A04G081300v2 [Gossypium hirsutum]|uniref:Uncharacterized protein n=1 Tax=Gossypium tomentosum TaxID=34277 RepID=A0A5D2QWZ6_GOSTO|nr:hypothetical protein ERO13_A04G081300v2 [Gossypium hirsutum]TYI33156.1 hypothetical protein ES332_A04G112700v1 [Gossypium tomentosum]TYI33157.1 hypothetical protein ES332_A04G112700v1 [Gossypium tomentosum]